MAFTPVNGRLVPDPFEGHRIVAESYEEIVRLREADFRLYERLSRSRKLIKDAEELLARVRLLEP